MSGGFGWCCWGCSGDLSWGMVPLGTVPFGVVLAGYGGIGRYRASDHE